MNISPPLFTYRYDNSTSIFGLSRQIFFPNGIVKGESSWSWYMNVKMQPDWFYQLHGLFCNFNRWCNYGQLPAPQHLNLIDSQIPFGVGKWEKNCTKYHSVLDFTSFNEESCKLAIFDSLIWIMAYKLRSFYLRCTICDVYISVVILFLQLRDVSEKYLVIPADQLEETTKRWSKIDRHSRS